ncbi:MAG: hypothetical protein DSY76_02805 [Bacteroidetes bacterium]|nr:MAG: hypothetical protein DSY76_02805 [Bacteroidota bacterium]
MKSFMIRLLALTAFTEVVALGWWIAMPQQWVSPVLPVLPVFFMSVTFLIHKGFVGAINLRPQQFVTRFMLITTIKLLSFLALLLVYALMFKDDAIQFLLSFFVIYLIYSAFEVVAVMKLNKKNS